ARKVDADGGTTCIYWATGPGGGKVEEIGDFRAEEAERHTFGPPKQFGTGTQLLPAVKYFVERFKDAPWGFYVFITDGELHDVDNSRIKQGLPDTATVPPSQVASGVTATPRAKPQATPAPAAPAKPQQPANLDNIEEVLEAEPASLEAVTEDDDDSKPKDDEW